MLVRYFIGLARSGGKRAHLWREHSETKRPCHITPCGVKSPEKREPVLVRKKALTLLQAMETGELSCRSCVSRGVSWHAVKAKGGIEPPTSCVAPQALSR